MNILIAVVRELDRPTIPTHRWERLTLRRLAAAGVLAKRRGTGRANAPAWQITCSVDEALRRL
jgi:hypothetical protein